MNHNEFNAKASSQVTAILRSYWRARRYMYILPAGLAFWTLILTISHISSYDDPEHTLEKKGRYDPMSTLTLEQNPTAYKPILLNPLPPQEYTYQWPPNVRKPLCMPKIYVYPDSAKMGEFQVTEVPHMGTNYIGEQILLAQLRDKSSSVYKNYVTENPEEADFFYIPFVGSKYLCDCWFTKGIKGDCDVDENYAIPMMRHIREDYPYWNRTWGRDHIMAHPMDSASNYYKTKDMMANATFLTTVGDKRVASGVDGRSRRYDDIVIPSATALLNLVAGMVPEEYLTPEGQPLTGKRDILAIFGGRYKDVKPEDSYSAGIRSLLFNGLDKQPDYKFAGGWDNAVYTQLLTQSRYGLAPMGYTLDTTRIWEYIAFGVVPIIIADGIIEPFEDDMDWDSFTVRVRRADAHRLDVILRSIPETEYERKRIALWTHGRQALLNKDAWNLIVRSLCRKGRLEGMRTINHDYHVPLESTASV